ncbi:hypothetical protein [Burkholderia sp. LMG 13014]|uniref:hypothetical protein n=1 Tax=Burkholderia sp. LMG 13014 TaxID=2709306 RepID=UPI0019668EF0|nr:hypothetical protein [Burkholderia sp. LMG 13014]
MHHPDSNPNYLVEYVGDQLKNNLDYVDWLVSTKYSDLTQDDIDADYGRFSAIGSEISNQCKDNGGNLQLDLLRDLLAKNRFKKQLAIDLNRGKNDAPTRKLKI